MKNGFLRIFSNMIKFESGVVTGKGNLECLDWNVIQGFVSSTFE